MPQADNPDRKVPGKLPTDDPEGLRAALHRWFAEVGKDYPWRRTRDPYEVLVSEVMLQQTQVATVLGRGYYRRWLERFPDLAALAAAPEEEVLRAWEGLGYYSRARNLHAAAKAVVAGHGGEFPREVERIAALPGVGRYTAGAVACFAFGQAVATVDANIARVLARLFDHRERVDTAKGAERLWGWAAELVPGRGAREWNSALMELGQTLCRAKAAACDLCPAAAWCACADPLALPMKKPRPKVTEVDEHVLVAVRGGRILLQQETGRRRRGLWKLPARAPAQLGDLAPTGRRRYSITRYRVTMHLYQTGEAQAAGPDERWFDLAELPGLPMPSPYRRAVEALFSLRADPSADAHGGGPQPGVG